MKKLLPWMMAAMMFAGCTSSKNQINYVRRIDPIQFTVMQVSNNSKFTDAIPAGRYEFSMDDDTAGSNPARYSIYMSDVEYDAMNSDLEKNLINSIGPGQDIEINLKDGNYLYIAATSNKTGSYEDNLTGPLEIESE